MQSGSDRILAAMSRGYDREPTIWTWSAGCARPCPDLALTTDLIVGFPGETEEDFAQTLSLVEECGFDGAFTFIYSPRRGHRGGGAAGPAAGRRRRGAHDPAGRRWCSDWRSRKNQALVGRTVEVLVERASRQSAGEVMGRTRDVQDR